MMFNGGLAVAPAVAVDQQRFSSGSAAVAQLRFNCDAQRTFW